MASNKRDPAYKTLEARQVALTAAVDKESRRKLIERINNLIQLEAR